MALKGGRSEGGEGGGERDDGKHSGLASADTLNVVMATASLETRCSKEDIKIERALTKLGKYRLFHMELIPLHQLYTVHTK